jgi:hypothetical protein
MPRSFLLFLVLACCAASPAETTNAAPAPPICLNGDQTREEIAAHRLLQPFTALKSASATIKAEPLSAKLCKFGEEYIYEITLLHRNGRVIHLVRDAATGDMVNSRNPFTQSRESPKTSSSECPILLRLLSFCSSATP